MTAPAEQWSIIVRKPDDAIEMYVLPPGIDGSVDSPQRTAAIERVRTVEGVPDDETPGWLVTLTVGELLERYDRRVTRHELPEGVGR